MNRWIDWNHDSECTCSEFVVSCTSRGVEVCDTQTSMSAECCCMPSQWYLQIRSWCVTSAARRLALVDVPERVQYKLGLTVRRCQQHKAPQYLTDCVTSASDIASRQRLRCASRHQLLVPRYQLSSLGRRSLAVAGPTTWNSLSADLRDPTCSDESFRRSLKTFLFAKY